MSNHYKKKKQQEQTGLEVIIMGLAKMIWWLVMLPFGGLKKKAGFSDADRREILTRRLAIEQMVSDDVNALKQAVFEADKLVDFVLKTKNYGGESFADRLRSAEDDINPTLYQKIWQGHKVRNQIAHEHDYVTNAAELKQAIYNLLDYIKSI